jgi:hypothetical protein
MCANRFVEADHMLVVGVAIDALDDHVAGKLLGASERDGRHSLHLQKRVIGSARPGTAAPTTTRGTKWDKTQHFPDASDRIDPAAPARFSGPSRS